MNQTNQAHPLDLAQELVAALTAEYISHGLNPCAVDTSVIGYLTGMLADCIERSQEARNSVVFHTEWVRAGMK